MIQIHICLDLYSYVKVKKMFLDKYQFKFQDKVTELEEKYRKAMVQIAQLDDEKQALVYQTEDLKDK